MRRWLWQFLLVAIFLGFNHPLSAEAATQVINPQVEYTFGGQITFRAEIQSDIPIKEARLYFRGPGDSNPTSVTVTLDGQGQAVYEYDLIRHPLRAFSKVEYWFEVTTEGGNVFKSELVTFYYEDNRFAWETQQNGPFRVHWYEGDAAFGQALLEVAQKGLQQAQNWLPFGAPSEVNIYAYASAQEMQSTLMLAGVSWVAGHADPELGVVVVSLPEGPEQRTEMERQIPHELVHILLYQLIGPAYRNLPIWLNEGLASITEIYPNPNYHTILTNAVKKGSLLPLASLCPSFPVDTSGAYLAYAEAASFTRFLYDQYGQEGLEALVAMYADGTDCENGVQEVLGNTLDQLEQSWRSTTLGEKAASTTTESLWPWLVVLVIILGIPLGVGVGVRRSNSRIAR
jgi:hypothetical protein